MRNKTKNIDNLIIKVKNNANELINKKLKPQKKNLYYGGVLASRTDEEKTEANQLEEEKKKLFMEETNKDKFKFNINSLDDKFFDMDIDAKKRSISNMATEGMQIKNNLTKTFRKEGIIPKTEEEEKEEEEEEEEKLKLKLIKQDINTLLSQAKSAITKILIAQSEIQGRIFYGDLANDNKINITDDMLVLIQQSFDNDSYEKITRLLKMVNYNIDEINTSFQYIKNYLDNDDNTFEDLSEAKVAIVKELDNLRNIKLNDIRSQLGKIQKIFDINKKKIETKKESSDGIEDSSDDKGEIIEIPILNDDITLTEYILSYFIKKGLSDFAKKELSEIYKLYNVAIKLFEENNFLSLQSNDSLSISDETQQLLTNNSGNLTEEDLKDVQEDLTHYIENINNSFISLRREIRNFIEDMNNKQKKLIKIQKLLIRKLIVVLKDFIYDNTQTVRIIKEKLNNAFNPPKKEEYLLYPIKRQPKKSKDVKAVESTDFYSKEFKKTKAFLLTEQGKKMVARQQAKKNDTLAENARKREVEKLRAIGATGGDPTKYKSSGESVYILYKNRKYKRVIYVKAKRNTKYCKINNEYILLSKLKIIEL